jgi:hypothetical protein
LRDACKSVLRIAPDDPHPDSHPKGRPEMQSVLNSLSKKAVKDSPSTPHQHTTLDTVLLPVATTASRKLNSGGGQQDVGALGCRSVTHTPKRVGR